jgi:hypothetical protein
VVPLPRSCHRVGRRRPLRGARPRRGHHRRRPSAITRCGRRRSLTRSARWPPAWRTRSTRRCSS